MLKVSRIAGLLLVLLLASCGGKQDPIVVVRTETKRETPPAEWLVVGQKPPKNYRTTGELYRWSEKLEAAYDILEQNLIKIGVWAVEVKASDTSPEQK